MKKSMLKDTAILFAITLISGLILGAVYQLTKEPIAEQEEKAKTEARQEVFADAASFADAGGFDPRAAQAVLDTGGFSGCSIDECAQALDEDGNALGWVITVTTHEGYSGDIQFTVGVRNDGTMNGMSILSISETAGLGMRAGEFLAPQFAGKKADSFVYTKSGASADNEIDAISSATITTSAVVDGVNAGLYYFQTELTQQEGGNGDE
ncbi:MAG TPA: RnfABCDGE type electron transport complex subunit G [Candidatus Eisenbergiella merdipullorum]|uniref:Ion-translocating oxidoreductase complex subunit G n=1 Tax=Candidatus Eisenbergiella merdipullorum TaxID=2838553 RepID=A0A9D2I5W2_9FIRM|nr:RnfABCDGE type electron transport complex subunit G [Candidatus Eisenbergiella merdipullorum]